MRGERAERFVVLNLRLLAASFAVVGVLFISMPDGVLEALDDLGAWLPLGSFSPAPETLITATSSGGNAPISLAGYRLPVDVVTVNDVPPLMTWLFVTMSPRESKTMPEPSPC